MTVVKPPEFSPSIDEVEKFYSDAEAYYKPMLEQVRHKAEDYKQQVTAKLLRGHPAESIVKYAYENHADMIVIGIRGINGFKNLLIGSVAQKVVSYSRVPALVIKD